MPKRPEKKLTVNFINTQYACLTNNVPGVTLETIAAQIDYGHYFLYKGEVEAIALKLMEKDPQFDPENYVQFLNKVNALREGAAPAFGGDRATTLDSKEKALDVAANPDNEVEVAEIMRLAKVLSDARKDINKLLATGVTLGIGFNSGARKKALAKEAAKIEGSEPEATEEVEE